VEHAQVLHVDEPTVDETIEILKNHEASSRSGTQPYTSGRIGFGFVGRAWQSDTYIHDALAPQC
jgi:hypothetical protein